MLGPGWMNITDFHIKGAGTVGCTVCLACVKPLGCLIDSRQKFHEANASKNWVQ